MSSRDYEIIDFLGRHAWGEAQRVPVPGDASARRYERLSVNGHRAVLMDSPFDPSTISTYMRKGRLAGNNISAFVCLATALRQRGFGAPDIYAADIERGLVMLEDLGDDLIARVLERQPELEREIYTRAVEVAAAIYRSSFSPDLSAYGTRWQIKAYDFDAFMAETDLFLDWYVEKLETPISQTARNDWLEIWRETLSQTQTAAPGLALRDFHAENLFWRQDKIRLEQIGLIDFQDAVFTHPAYDLVSLLEDARRDVSPDLVAPLIEHFCTCAKIENNQDFQSAYAILGAQRNAKILGIFVRLSKRDNKHQYLDFLPRVRAHFTHDLDHPALVDLKLWIEKHAPSSLEAS